MRITKRIAHVLRLTPDEARALQQTYWKKYGTSLRGLILHHGVDPEPFLAYVHDVPIAQYLCENPALRVMLGRIDGLCHVFTNSPGDYAARVLETLGVTDMFDHVFDIRHSEFHSKPDPHAYHCVLRTLGEPGDVCLLVDDTPHNLAAAKACGMVAVWLRSPQSVAGGQRGGSVELRRNTSPPHIVIDAIEDLAPAVQSYFDGR